MDFRCPFCEAELPDVVVPEACPECNAALPEEFVTSFPVPNETGTSPTRRMSIRFPATKVNHNLATDLFAVPT